jgi:hypothetical protein
MKDLGRYGVVLVVPDADPLQQKWGTALWDLMRTEVPAAREVLCEAVFLTVRRPLAERILPKVEERKNRYLLDPSGAIVASDEVDLYVLEDAPRFGAAFRNFIHGIRDERLKAQAAGIAARLPAVVREAVRRLEADDVDERERGVATLKDHADAILPWLIEQRASLPTAEARGRISSLIDRLFQAADSTVFGPRLPFGARIPKFNSGSCGGFEVPEGQENAPLPACGLAAAGPDPRKFLRFLSK